MVAHLICNQAVAGSSPVSSTKLSPAFLGRKALVVDMMLSVNPESLTDVSKVNTATRTEFIIMYLDIRYKYILVQNAVKHARTHRKY